MAQRESAPETPGAWYRRLPLVLAIIALVTAAVYLPVLQNGFVDYDDPDYVTVNPMVRQGLTLKGLAWAFTAFHAGNWHPLTWLSHMLDIQLFDLAASGHHAVSLLFHIANALLLCLVLRALTGSTVRSAFVALLFALHPLHVESVAWVAERKDVLSTFFWLATMLAYLWYVAKPSLKRYLAVALLLALGLLAKQMLVTLPVVLLLLDFWPLGRLRLKDAGEGIPLPKLLLEKAPLLGIAGAAAAVTILAQSAGGAIAARHGGYAGSVLVNWGNALIAYPRYLIKMVWPLDLAIFYPLNPGSVTAVKVAGAAVVIAALTAGALWQLRRRPYLAFGWFWYLVTLLPVAGFIKVGSQAIADRYTYVPLIGIFVVLVWGIAEIAGRWTRGPQAAVAAGVAVLALCSALTVTQIGYWRTPYQLYDHALQAVPDNWLAHNNMAILQAQQYRFDEATRHFQESLRINPDQAEGYLNYANVLQATGQTGPALQALQESVRLNPSGAQGHFRLGYAYLIAGNPDLAYREYEQLQQLDQVQARSLLDSIRMAGRR
ncbi:tetratricopeptide repeat protein [Geomesophilobacter sediminis]|uniref:Glycosyltransferase family 39 protein n=1 Tax=Geomesophilobacter sediminis TaxID=2798584 RepID=A0A8J7M233_9BACT|nr:tetratricopeptide repeat protein [Geomesophilobacter sediminis]MBJ6727294.1 glycosyltransferase family 39 protein [Geomesophilobacter sediminis]